MAVNKNKVFHCNIELALDIVGGKWKPLIVYHLSNIPVIRFGEFKRLIPDVNERVLARQLRELQEHKIIERKDYHENPPKVEYFLTERGKTLSPIIIDLGEWAKIYNKDFDYGEIQFQNKYNDEHC
ncbi:winged helix-turn-helix transcriptional regulator [Clostridium sp. DL1XJH146]